MSSLILLLSASLTSAHAVPQCPSPEQLAHLDGFAAQLAEAGTADEARDLATRRIERSSRALTRASRIVKGDPGLAEATARLDDLQARIDAADSPTAVAAVFQSAQGDLAASCDYTTGEIVAIVIGFILGIIPGVLLLVLLC